jgi:hypothetical protein
MENEAGQNGWTQEVTPSRGQSKPWWRARENERFQGIIKRFFQTKDARSGVMKTCCEVKLTAAARAVVEGNKEVSTVQEGTLIAVEIKPGMRALERYGIGTEVAVQAIDKSGEAQSWTFKVAHRGLLNTSTPVVSQDAPRQADIPF